MKFKLRNFRGTLTLNLLHFCGFNAENEEDEVEWVNKEDEDDGGIDYSLTSPAVCINNGETECFFI